MPTALNFIGAAKKDTPRISPIHMAAIIEAASPYALDNMGHS
jgi:hypothetical protein